MFSRLYSLFVTPSPTLPPADVRVVPCSGIDLAGRDLVVTTGFVIDARLDTKKLEDTLAVLVEQKFPRAGARLALRNGSYEFHIPKTFDAQTPPVGFTAEDHCEPYASSMRPPIQHLLNASASEPWICSSPLLEPYFRSPSCPTSLEAFLVPNTPLIHVHVTVFDDFTFLGITSSHIMFDALGISTIMQGWQRTPTPGHMCHRGWYDLGLLAKIAFIVCFMWKILRDRKEEHKAVRVPKAFVEERKREIMKELKAERSEDWVGSSDVLMAWWFKASYNHRTDATPLHFHLTVNLRDMRIFPETYKDDLDGIAADVRSCCAQSLQVFPHPPGAEYSLQSNLRKGKLGEADFSAAAVGEAGLKPRARVRYVTAFPWGPGIPLRGTGMVLFEDEQAIWMNQVRGVKDWERVKKAGELEFI
ncbi:hypothetical protein K438DRAFT_1835157 [Mycena galopus ATCC 62051]|nr:hypothetical protein K438DRAFT_1835157 [Mycena galopus ATCC 62051]